MANMPVIQATCKVTCKDINNNSVAKQFNSVTDIDFDFATGRLNVVDATGSFYFPLKSVTTTTFTITNGIAGVTQVVIA